MPASDGPRRGASDKRRWLAVGVVTAVVLCGVGIVVAARFWPFTRSAVIASLQQLTGGKVDIRQFHSRYFPQPGCVAEGINLQAGSQKFPPVTIQKLTIRTGFMSLLAKHIEQVKAEGVYVRFARQRSKPVLNTSPGTTIGRVVINGATLEFATHDPESQPVRFEIHQLTLTSLSGKGPIVFSTSVRNPVPPGDLSVTGRIGPWKPKSIGQTPLEGSYEFNHAILGALAGISGTLFSTGRFHGVLERIDVQGTTDTPDFETKETHHRMHLRTEFHAVVEGRNGDTSLQAVDAQLRNTRIACTGTVARRPGEKGKTASLDMSAKGRIDDLFWIFAKSPVSPITGAVALRTKVLLPPGTERFIRKIRLDGQFEIKDGHFTNPKTQAGINILSQGALGKKRKLAPPTIPTELSGQLVLSQGVARFSRLAGAVPGASAQFGGTYSLLNQRINLHGTLRTDATLSHQASGIKSVLLKPLDLIYKKKSAGAVAPVRITGTYDHPSYGLAPGSKQASGK